MKKLKLICFFLLLGTLSCLFSQSVLADYPDVSSQSAYYEAVKRLEGLEILSGYEDGKFHPERNLTRAQFAKIIVCIMNAETQAMSYTSSSNFYDVSTKNWALPYISYITSKGIISGYPDGSFAPEKPITYAEALTIVGKLLGYEEKTIGYYWPNNYVTLAKNINLTKDINFNATDPVSRANASVLIDRALFSNMGSTSKGNLLENLGYTIIENIHIIASRNEDESLSHDQISTSAGIFDISKSFDLDNVGSFGTAIIDSDNTLLQFSPSQSITPILASHDYSDKDNTLEGKSINKETLTVYRNGKASTLSDIRKNDVVYYNQDADIIDVYTKKVTGIYYDALPSKAYVNEVTVAGKTYKIGSKDATKKLDASAGSFELGEKVTLLLGKNDEVVFVVELTDFDSSKYGVLLSSGQKVATSGENEGSSEFYVEIYMPNGETYEYPSNKKYSDYIGKLVKLNFEGKTVSLSAVNTSDKSYGKIDYTNRKLGNKTVLKDVCIIQRLSGEDETPVRLKTLNFETLEKSSLSSENVIASVSANKFGDIGILYVTGLSGDIYYGVLKSKSDSSPYTYSIYEESGLSKYTSSGNFSVTYSTGISFSKKQDGSITNIKSLYKLASASKLDAIEGGRVMINGETYKMHSNVVIVDISDFSNYKIMTIDELSQSLKTSGVTIYSDSSAQNDGYVHVITVKR